jgi:hypothetical protein
VHVVGECLDAVREPGRVGNEVAVLVALWQCPAVVEVDVLVSCGLQAGGDEEVRGGEHHLLVELGAVLRGVPVVPAHRGRGCERQVEAV